MPTRGFVFATTGPEYTALAQRAALSVRQHCPNIPIDLFTDQPLTDETFARIHQLETTWFRPKMESMYRARFEHTVYLDADLLVIADISDIFDMLGRFDLAAAHDQYRNSTPATSEYTQPIPAAFPQYNGGLLAVKRNDQTQAFLKRWEQALIDSEMTRDQPILREILFDSTLSICTLPPEYNVHRIEHLRTLTSDDGAPRVIHHHSFHQHISTGNFPITSVQELLGSSLFNHLQKLIAADTSLNPNGARRKVPAYCDIHRGKPMPSPYRIKGKSDLKQKLKNPFHGTYGEGWYGAVKKWFTRG